MINFTRLNLKSEKRPTCFKLAIRLALSLFCVTLLLTNGSTGLSLMYMSNPSSDGGSETEFPYALTESEKEFFEEQWFGNDWPDAGEVDVSQPDWADRSRASQLTAIAKWLVIERIDDPNIEIRPISISVILDSSEIVSDFPIAGTIMIGGSEGPSEMMICWIRENVSSRPQISVHGLIKLVPTDDNHQLVEVTRTFVLESEGWREREGMFKQVSN